MKIFKRHSLEDFSSSRTSHRQSLDENALVSFSNHRKSSKKKHHKNNNKHAENGEDKFEERQDTELFFFDICGNKSNLDTVPSYISNKRLKNQHKQSTVEICEESLPRKKKKNRLSDSFSENSEAITNTTIDSDKNVSSYNILPLSKKKKKRKGNGLNTVTPIEIGDDTDNTKKDTELLIDIRDSDCEMSYSKSNKKKKKARTDIINGSIEENGARDVNLEREKSDTEKNKWTESNFGENEDASLLYVKKKKRSNSVNEKNREIGNKSDMLIDIRDSDCEVYSFKVPSPVKKKKKHKVKAESTQKSEYKIQSADKSCSDIETECELLDNSAKLSGKHTSSNIESELLEEVNEDIVYLSKKKKKKKRHVFNNDDDILVNDGLKIGKHTSSSMESVVLGDIKDNLHSNKKKKKKRDSENKTSEIDIPHNKHKGAFNDDNEGTLDNNPCTDSTRLIDKHTSNNMESELIEKVKEDILHLFKKKNRDSGNKTSDINIDSTPNKKHSILNIDDDTLVNKDAKLIGKDTSIESIALEDIKDNILHSNRKKKKKRDSENKTSEIDTPHNKHKGAFNDDNEGTLDNNPRTDSARLTDKHTSSNTENELIEKVKEDILHLFKKKKRDSGNKTSDINIDSTPNKKHSILNIDDDTLVNKDAKLIGKDTSIESIALEDIKDNILHSNRKKKKKRDSGNETIKINGHSTPYKEHDGDFNNDIDNTFDNNSLNSTRSTDKHTSSNIESELIEMVKDDILHLFKKKKRDSSNQTSDRNVDSTPNKKHTVFNNDNDTSNNNLLNKDTKLNGKQTSCSMENQVVEHIKDILHTKKKKKKRDSGKETSEINIHNISYKKQNDDNSVDHHMELSGKHTAGSLEKELLEVDDSLYLFKKKKNNRHSEKEKRDINIDSTPNKKHNVLNNNNDCALINNSSKLIGQHTSSSEESELLEEVKDDIVYLFKHKNKKKNSGKEASDIDINSTPKNDNDSMEVDGKQKPSSVKNDLLEKLIEDEVFHLFKKKKKKKRDSRGKGKKTNYNTPNKNRSGDDGISIAIDSAEPTPLKPPKQNSRCDVLVDIRDSDCEMTFSSETSRKKKKKSIVRESESSVEDTSKEFSRDEISETSYSNSQDSSRLSSDKNTSLMENSDIVKPPGSPHKRKKKKIAENNIRASIDLENSILIEDVDVKKKKNHLTEIVNTPENVENSTLKSPGLSHKKKKRNLMDDLVENSFQSFKKNTNAILTNSIGKDVKFDEHLLEDGNVSPKKSKRQLENESVETDGDNTPKRRHKKGRTANEETEEIGIIDVVDMDSGSDNTPRKRHKEGRIAKVESVESGINLPLGLEETIKNEEITKDVLDTDSDSDDTPRKRPKKGRNAMVETEESEINLPYGLADISRAETAAREALGVVENSQKRNDKKNREEIVTDNTENDSLSEQIIHENPRNDSDTDDFNITHVSRSQLPSEDDTDVETEKAMEKIRLLDVGELNIAPLHQLLTRASFPTKEQTDQIKRLNLEVKTGPFTKEEDEKILANWKSFCEKFGFQMNPTIFLDFPRRSQDKKMQFLRYISQGLDNRLLHRIYARFKNVALKNKIKGGRFSAEEDRVILEYMKCNFSHRPYSELAQKLGRTRLAIEKRHKRLTNPVKTVLHWTPDLIDTFLRRLKRVTKCHEIKELEDRKITLDEWRKLSKKMGQVPVRKLQNAWERNIYPRLFVNDDVDLRKIKAKIVKRLIKRRETDWRAVDWKTIAKKFHGFTHSKIYQMFKHLVMVHVPLEMQPNLEDSLKFLNDKLVKYNNIPTTHKFKKIEYNDDPIVKEEKFA